MPKRILSGKVVSANSQKTIVVKVTRRVKHKLYKKIISLSKKYWCLNAKIAVKAPMPKLPSALAVWKFKDSESLMK